MFTSLDEQLERTELVIVLTPHVVKSPTQFEEIRVMTDQQVDRLTLPPALLDKIKTGELDKQGLFDQEGYNLEIRDLEDAITPSDLPVESSP